jgi:hypothetical protein
VSGTATALESLVERLEPDTPDASWLIAACGIPPAQIADLSELMVAHSHEAAIFLDRMPQTMRGLVSSTTMETERCVGQVRGPILWSETVTAWSAGIGAEDVFVCVAPRRDYDLAENRAVAWLLQRIARAPMRLDTAASMYLDPSGHDLIRRHATEARRWLRHRFLDGIEARRPTAGDLRRVRTSRHRAVYGPTQALLSRVLKPLHADELTDVLDERTADQMHALRWLVEELDRRGRDRLEWSVASASLTMGELVFRHAAHFGPQDRGIWLGSVAIDAAPGISTAPAATLDQVAGVTAALNSRAGGRPWCVVADRSDASLAVQLAIDVAANSAADH